MKTDRITKILLGLIAIGLWMNALIPVIKPTAAWADQLETYVAAIYNGTCVNRKICG